MNFDYDFTDDTLGNKENNINYKEYQSKKGLEKFLMYRLSKNRKKDPDLYSAKLKEIYKEKWGK